MDLSINYRSIFKTLAGFHADFWTLTSVPAVSFLPFYPDQDALRNMFGTMAKQERSSLHNNPRIMLGVLNMMPSHHTEGLKHGVHTGILV